MHVDNTCTLWEIRPLEFQVFWFQFQSQFLYRNKSTYTHITRSHDSHMTRLLPYLHPSSAIRRKTGGSHTALQTSSKYPEGHRNTYCHTFYYQQPWIRGHSTSISARGIWLRYSPLPPPHTHIHSHAYMALIRANHPETALHRLLDLLCAHLFSTSLRDNMEARDLTLP